VPQPLPYKQTAPLWSHVHLTLGRKVREHRLTIEQGNARAERETIMDTKERLDMCATLLGEIDRYRARTKDPGQGISIEHRIIERELRELEEDILADPGTLEAQLVRVRPKRAF
jgi:hypothetical protein